MSIDPGVWEQPDMRAALAVRDIGEVYRTLTHLGVSQRRIAALTGQAQSDVSEIIKGRAVKDYHVLERIAEGLGIPRDCMGLGYGETYPEEVPVAEPEGWRHCCAAILSTCSRWPPPVRSVHRSRGSARSPTG